MDSRLAILVCVVLGVSVGGVRPSHAQTVQRVQPIVLTASPGCCANPAATAHQRVLPPCGDCTYLPPDKRDPVQLISTSSRLVPLPTPEQWRNYESRNRTVTGHPESVTTMLPPSGLPPRDFAPGVLPAARLPASLPTTLMPNGTTVQVFRPVVVAPLAPSVPEGYVVGKGLVGQPKLYKPGQPVRNFLRYITL